MLKVIPRCFDILASCVVFRVRKQNWFNADGGHPASADGCFPAVGACGDGTEFTGRMVWCVFMPMLLFMSVAVLMY